MGSAELVEPVFFLPTLLSTGSTQSSLYIDTNKYSFKVVLYKYSQVLFKSSSFPFPIYVKVMLF